MAISIKDLVKDLTKESVLETLLLVAKSLGLPTTAWQPGEPALSLMAIFAEWFASLWNSPIAPAIRAAFLDYASMDWLTLAAFAIYGVIRRGATFATGAITIENRAGGVYTFVAGELRIRNGVTGKTYTNTTGGFLAAWPGSGAYPTIDLAFQCDEAGRAGNALAGEIESYPTAPVAASAGVYARTNGGEIYGQDAELDDALKERCRLSAATLSPAGPLDAYRFVALSTLRPDGTSVNVTRVRVGPPFLGVINIYLASDDGGAAGDSLTEGTDVYLVNVAVQTKVVPPGVVAVVSTAAPVDVAVTISVYVDRASGVTQAEAEVAAAAAVAKYFRELPIGGYTTSPGDPGYVVMSEIAAQVSESIGGIFRVTASTFDALLAQGAVAVPSPVSITVILVTQ